MRERVYLAADLLITFVIYWLMGVALHEYWHANVARALGYPTKAVFGWTWGYVVPEVMPAGWDAWVIALSGGGGVALFYIWIAFFVDDWEHDLVMWFFAPLHGSYAIFEALWYAAGVPFVWALIVPPVFASALAIDKAWRGYKWRMN